jgi:hypothetical protein
VQLGGQIENERNGEMAELVNDDGDRREKKLKKEKPSRLTPLSLALIHLRPQRFALFERAA